MDHSSDPERFADEFAAAAHGTIGQVRKYTGVPYIEHPRAVAAIVRSVPHTQAMVCAALLHDVCEDCGVPLHLIESKFGHDIAELVEQLTDVSSYEDGNRAARKAIDLAHTARASPSAKTVKLADLIENSSTIVEYDPKFALVYLPEKLQLLEVLREGDAMLWARAHKLALDGLTKLRET
jgi:guanosine-3',5'-bis(diphosphate) 3'-pyrophosphohydrolase